MPAGERCVGPELRRRDRVLVRVSGASAQLCRQPSVLAIKLLRSNGEDVHGDGLRVRYPGSRPRGTTSAEPGWELYGPSTAPMSGRPFRSFPKRGTMIERWPAQEVTSVMQTREARPVLSRGLRRA